MGKLTIFAKGNLDLRDSLHSLRNGSEIVWNGINEIVRRRYPATTVRLRHELWTRSDALLRCDGTIPDELEQRALPLEPYSLATQFSTAVFETDADAVILSLQPDVTTSLVRHRRDGYLFYPNNSKDWSPANKFWLRESFEKLELHDVGASMSNLALIIARLRGRSNAPILIYNLSSVVPGDTMHCYKGAGSVLATRIRRFNLALVELSEQTGISVIDIDAVFARAGADRLKVDAMHFTAEGCRLVAEEAVRVLDDVGCFSSREASRCS